MKKIARSDPVSRSELLFIRNEGRNPGPILPLESDDPEAFRKSPLFTTLSSQLENDNQISEMASSFMGPGPWVFHLDLKLPKTCSMLKPTNQNKRANMVVSHLLKIVMRMERGDDRFVDKDGKRKMFDIVVQTPVHILSVSSPLFSFPKKTPEYSSHRLPSVDVIQNGLPFPRMPNPYIKSNTSFAAVHVGHLRTYIYILVHESIPITPRRCTGQHLNVQHPTTRQIRMYLQPMINQLIQYQWRR